MAGAEWKEVMPWLEEVGHTPSADEAAALNKYFTEHPQQLVVTDDHENLPLHCVVRYQKGEHAAAIVAFLLEAYPDGVRGKAKTGQVPLHVAAVYQKGEHGAAIVSQLLNAYPAGAKEKDGRWLLPLHRAVQKQSGEHGAAIVTLLLKAHPRSARQKIHGALPLHKAARYQEGEHGAAILMSLLDVYPDGVKEKDDNGMLPLYKAAMSKGGEHAVAIVTLLLNVYPAAAMQKDKTGKLPADIAEGNKNKFPASCIAMLRAAAQGNWTPPTPMAPPPTAAAAQAAKPELPTVINPKALTPAKATVDTAVEAEPMASAAVVLSNSSPAFPTFAAGHFANISTTPIGSGTHKTVFSATYIGPTTSTLQSGCEVALLCFKQDIAPNFNEYKVMTDIRAPNLAKFYGSVQPSAANDTHLRLVSDLAMLGCLRHFFRDSEQGISLSNKLVIAKQAGDGLSALHEHGLVHADVAARNVLVYVFDADIHHRTHVKLSDYGMVRERSEYDHSSAGVASASASGMAAGEPLPLAPKWASWGSLNNDWFFRASDVWSFGVLIWEILTECSKPYPGVASTIPAMIKHLSEGHRLSKPPGCSNALWAVISKCWHENKNKRPLLKDVLGQIALGLEEAAVDARLTAAIAQVAAAEAEVEAMKLAKLAWLRKGYGWRAGSIELSPNLDQELTYMPRSTILCADPRAVGTGPLATALADAIDDLVLFKGGSKGGRFRANVEAITLCKNQRLIASFNECLWKRHTQRQENQGTASFNGRWDDPSFVSGAALQDKQTVFARLERLFAETDVGAGPGVKVTLMWHGVPSPEVADAICRTGLSMRVSGNDQGYFGKGVYLTPEAEYAAFYANGQRPLQREKSYTLLLCAVCTANPYPLTRGKDYGSDGEAISKFHYNYGAHGTAKALYKGFDAHFVAINTKESWQAATSVADADYHELVVGSEDQVLPFAQVVVRIK